MERHKIFAIVLLLFVAIVSVIASREFMEMWKPDIIHAGHGVTTVRKLSEYCPSLLKSRADSDVFYLDSGNPGGTILVLGGTHPNEPAGFITAVLLIENVTMTQGRMIVIPQACASGFTCTDPLEGYPEKYFIRTKTGEREFRFGARAANPIDQWPDPLVFLQYPSGQQLSGNETRNLNRAYPGRADGTLTEQTAYAIMQLIEKESVNIAIDLHEAAPEIPIINAVVTHPKSRDIGGAAVLNLEFVGLQYSLEISPDNFHGLSHREWGDRTSALPFLMETSNPIQGRLRGVTSEALILEGKDIRYKKAAELGRMRITYEPEGEPLALRVGRHLQGIKEIITSCNDVDQNSLIQYNHLPTYDDLISKGVGEYLK
jgi:hypothetical protein